MTTYFLMLLYILILVLPSILIAIVFWVAWSMYDITTTVLFHKYFPLDEKKKTVLLMGGNTVHGLHLARLFKAEGYRTVVGEVASFRTVNITAWSNCCDFFYTLPNPSKNPTKYISTLTNIAKRHKPVIFIPMNSKYAQYDGDVISKIQHICYSLTLNEETRDKLQNVSKFYRCLGDMKLNTSESYYIIDKKQVLNHLVKSQMKKFILKPVLHNEDNIISQDIVIPEYALHLLHFLDCRYISKECPYILQEMLSLPKFISNSLLVNGNIIYTTMSITSPNHNIVNNLKRDDIIQWIEHFISRYPKRLNGWISFTFMYCQSRKRFAVIKCRQSVSQTCILFKQSDGLVKALERHLYSEEDTVTRESSYINPSKTQAYWLLNELWVILANLTKPTLLLGRSVTLFTGTEVVYDVSDPMPFIIFNFFIIPFRILKDMFTHQNASFSDYFF